MLTLGSLFDGIGTWQLSAEKAGIKPVWSSEIEKFPMEISKRHFPNTIQLGDITKINGAEIPPVDIICAGSPCFVAGTMVRTNRGIIPIEEVEIGDKVITHTNAWKVVTEKMKHGAKNLYTFRAEGCVETIATGNHPYYVRYVDRVWDNENKTNKRVFSEPEWVELQNIKEPAMIGYPINLIEENPLNLTEEECWLIGRYVADGYIKEGLRKDRVICYNHSIILCIGKDKDEYFHEHIKTYHTCKRESVNNTTKYEIISERLMNFCKLCGSGAENKKIPTFIQNLPKNLLLTFLDGYISGDGCFIESQSKYSMTTVSKDLAYGLQCAIHKAYRVACNIYFNERPKTYVIEGRVVNQKDTWQITFIPVRGKQAHYTVIDDVIWRNIRYIEPLEDCYTTVYNLEVEGDHSYTANGVIVHNCQDLSIAGRQAGLAGERSGLFVEALRICREMRDKTNGEYPKYFVWENVPGAFSSNNKQDFKAVLEEIAETSIPMPKSGRWANAGLVRSERCELAWRVLDAQYWGVPQRRKRIFLVADFRKTFRCAGEILLVEQGLSGNTQESEGKRENTSSETERSAGEASTVETTSDKVGSLNYDDYKGINNQYVDQHKCIIEKRYYA